MRRGEAGTTTTDSKTRWAHNSYATRGNYTAKGRKYTRKKSRANERYRITGRMKESRFFFVFRPFVINIAPVQERDLKNLSLPLPVFFSLLVPSPSLSFSLDSIFILIYSLFKFFFFLCPTLARCITESLFVCVSLCSRYRQAIQ